MLHSLGHAAPSRACCTLLTWTTLCRVRWHQQHAPSSTGGAPAGATSWSTAATAIPFKSQEHVPLEPHIASSGTNSMHPLLGLHPLAPHPGPHHHQRHHRVEPAGVPTYIDGNSHTSMEQSASLRDLASVPLKPAATATPAKRPSEVGILLALLPSALLFSPLTTRCAYSNGHSMGRA